MKKKMSIEESFTRLSEIHTRIEGSIPLDEAIALYKEGLRIAEICGQTIKKYEQEVLVLRQKADETFVLEHFEEYDNA